MIFDEKTAEFVFSKDELMALELTAQAPNRVLIRLPASAAPMLLEACKIQRSKIDDPAFAEYPAEAHGSDKLADIDRTRRLLMAVEDVLQSY